MSGVTNWNLSIGEEASGEGLSPREVSAFFGDTPWSRVTAYLVQSSKLTSGTGMTSREISRRIMEDFDEQSKAKVQRSVDRALEKMVSDGQAMYSHDRPRRYRLNSRRKSVREIQRTVSGLMSVPKKDGVATIEHVLPEKDRSEYAGVERLVLRASRLKPAAWRPVTIPPIQRLVIESLVEGSGRDPQSWVPRAAVFQRVHNGRACSQGRVSQVLGTMIDLGIIESRREGRNMLFRMGERCKGMDVEQAYEEYRKARSSARQPK